jgi:hypothetical protein
MLDELRGIYDRVEPYQYNILKIQLIDNYRHKLNKEDLRIADVVNTRTVFAIDEKIITFEKDLLDYAMLNNSNDFNIPWDKFFINNIIEYKDVVFNGISVHKENDGKILIASTCICKNSEEEFNTFFFLDNLKSECKEQKHLMHIVGNLLNALNSPMDVERINRTISKERNIKRAKKGKNPLKDTMYIRMNSQCMASYKQFKSGATKYKGKFIVRGHFRKYSTNNRVWIKPFYKGSGIDISKNKIKVMK